ncbi:hypothetical protein [Fibrella arboris]|uniref:hypothetical protein n=1 Tax=Fibrella arboris TaxID=3242486 RepID=UPI00351F9DF1
MNNKPGYLVTSYLTDAACSLQLWLPALMGCLLAITLSCQTDRSGLANGQKIKLNVGDIREVTVAARADTTWQLAATSDNQEIVDVSRKATLPGVGTGASVAGDAVFLIKGVTAGTARVVFSEKQPTTDGSGRIKKTYTVTVVSQ